MPPGVLFSAVEFGNLQKVHKPEAVCEDPEEGPVPESCSQHVSRGRGGGRFARGWGVPRHRGKGRARAVTEPRSACLQRAECEKLLEAAAFEACEGLVPRAPFVRACMQDRCRCPDGPSCACSTLAEFSRQCSHAGGQPGNWRTAEFCRKRHGAAGTAGEAGAPGAPRGQPSGERPAPLPAALPSPGRVCLLRGLPLPF